MRPHRPGRKLTEQDVALIREYRAVSHAVCARLLGVSRQLVQKVRAGEAWPAECKTTYAKRRAT